MNFVLSQKGSNGSENGNISRKEMQVNLNAVDRIYAFIEFDPQGNILTANNNFLSTMGYQLDEIKGNIIEYFVRPLTLIPRNIRISGQTWPMESR